MRSLKGRTNACIRMHAFTAAVLRTESGEVEPAVAFHGGVHLRRGARVGQRHKLFLRDARLLRLVFASECGAVSSGSCRGCRCRCAFDLVWLGHDQVALEVQPVTRCATEREMWRGVPFRGPRAISNVHVVGRIFAIAGVL